jgi:hypothetical protein
MTVNEKLVEMFGEDAPARVVGSEWARGMEVERAKLMSSEGTGFLQVTCSGQVLMAFILTEAVRKVSKLVVFLCFDDSDGQRWDVQKSQGVPPAERGWSRPHPRLTLNVSG